MARTGSRKLVSTMARVDWGSRLVRNLKGEQVISSALIYLSPDIKAIAHDDRIIIDGVEHLIVRIEEKADFKFDHWEIYIQ